MLERSHEGKVYFLAGRLAFSFVDEKTIVGGPEATLKKMLSSKSVSSPLTKRLSSLGAEHDLILAAAGESVERQLRRLASMLPAAALPPEFQSVPQHLAKIKSIAMTYSITRDPLLSVVLQMSDESAASDLAKIANSKALPVLKQRYEQLKKLPATPPGVVQFLDELLAGLAVGSVGDDVVVRLKRPSNLATLAALLLPAVQQAREAARRSVRKNNLRQIGVAMHNYHDTFKHFPGAGSNGAPQDAGRREGLSWRVYLLPFLDRKNLYEQFKLDEPWDSQHNIKLVKKMPELFNRPGTPNTGKTSIHVFVGPGTPFDETKHKRGLRLRDITDGPSNTILAVEAGADKAEAWTKPGGLPFQKGQTVSSLIGDGKSEPFFHLLMLDTFVRAFPTSINANQFGTMIQHADGAAPIDGR